MARRRTNKLVSIIVIGFVLLIVAIIGFVAYYTNGFSKDLTTFYVEYDGAKISDSLTGIYLPSGVSAEFDIKYIIPGQSGYRVSIASNPDNDFVFTVDGVPKDWSDIEDITYVFAIEKQSNSFILSLPCNFTIEEFIKTIYPGSSIIVEELPDSQTDYFVMTITSADGAQSVNIGFRIGNGVTGVTLDKEEIIF